MHVYIVLLRPLRHQGVIALVFAHSNPAIAELCRLIDADRLYGLAGDAFDPGDLAGVRHLLDAGHLLYASDDHHMASIQRQAVQ